MAINGLKELLRQYNWPENNLNDEQGMINYIHNALSGAIFFSPKIVLARHDVMLKILKNAAAGIKPYDVDDKGEKTWFQFRNGSHREEAISDGVRDLLIKGYTSVDKDNNNSTKQIIKQYTGLRVSMGRNSEIKNYTVCHVWGNVQNPIMLTSLWNVILMPSFKSALTDVSIDLEKTVVSDTIKAICWQLYNLHQILASKEKLRERAQACQIANLGVTKPISLRSCVQKVADEVCDYLLNAFATNKTPFPELAAKPSALAMYQS